MSKTKIIQQIEEELQEQLRTYFECPQVEVRPVSGQMANMVVFQAILKFINRGAEPGKQLKRMTRVMNNGSK